MKNALTIKEITMMGIFTALTMVFAQIAIPLPFTPMPISFGLVAVYMAGIMLKPWHAVLTQLCYLLLGAVGVPVFGNFRGGMGALLGPTGGYLMIYPVMTFIVAMVLNSRKSRKAETKQNKNLRLVKASIAIVVSHIILYLGGTLWLCMTTETSFLVALAMAVYPFILLDIVKIVFCIMVLVPLRSRFLSMNLLILDYENDEQTKK